MTVIAVYWLLTMGVPPVLGFFLAVLVTFFATTALYLGLIRPTWFLRPLFGMRNAGSGVIVRPAG